MLGRRCGTLLHCELSGHCAFYDAKPGIRTQTFFPIAIGEDCHVFQAKPKSPEDVEEKLSRLMGAHE